MVTYHIFFYYHMTGIITIYFCFNSNITIYFIVSHIVMCNIVTYHTVQGILLTNLQDALQCIYYKYNLIKNIIEKEKMFKSHYKN